MDPANVTLYYKEHIKSIKVSGLLARKDLKIVDLKFAQSKMPLIIKHKFA